MVTAPISDETLSTREREIAAAYAGGASYKEIARELEISPATVRAHLRTIYRKLGVASKAELAASLRSDASVPSIKPNCRVTVAVIPFSNQSEDASQRYFTEGLTEDVITELARFHQLSVLSLASAIHFREAVEAGAESGGVEYVVEGSVRRFGGRIRVTAKLTDLAYGRQLWADRYDQMEGEVFELQDSIVRQIVATLAGRIRVAMTERARRKLPANLEAYDCVLRGNAILAQDPDAPSEAGRLFERAIEIDPEYGQAYSKLAHYLSLAWFREQSDDRATLDRALELAKRGVTLDPEEPDSYAFLGWVYTFRRQFDLAERFFRRAHELNPNSAEHMSRLGDVHCFMGNSEEALRWFDNAQQLDPFFTPGHFNRMHGIAHFTANRLDEAIACFRRSPATPHWVWVYLAACYAMTGDRLRSKTSAKAILSDIPEFSLNRFAAKEPLRRPEDIARLINGMRLAGLPE